DDLKLRASLGYSGNNNGISAFGAQFMPQTNNVILYYFNGAAVRGFILAAPINASLALEESIAIHLVFVFSMFNQRVRDNIVLYDKLSDGLLMQRTLTVESGVPYMMDNIGSVNNRGVEVGLHTTNISRNDWEWTTSFMFSHNKNQIRSLYGKEEDVIGEARFIGQPIEDRKS